MSNQYIKLLKKKALSGADVLKLVMNEANLITYPQLAKMKSINEVFNGKPACIILYETKKGYGHWCCIIKQSPDLIEFFDSYGMKPDDQLNYVPKHYKIIGNEAHSHLSYLLEKWGGNVEYNHNKLQKRINDIATCGRHVGLRILLRDIPLPKYVKMLTRNKYFDPDTLVAVLTHNI